MKWSVLYQMWMDIDMLLPPHTPHQYVAFMWVVPELFLGMQTCFICPWKLRKWFYYRLCGSGHKLYSLVILTCWNHVWEWNLIIWISLLDSIRNAITSKVAPGKLCDVFMYSAFWGVPFLTAQISYWIGCSVYSETDRTGIRYRITLNRHTGHLLGCLRYLFGRIGARLPK